MKKDVSVIFVYYNTPKEIAASIATLNGALKGFTYELIIVDNASPEIFHRIINKKNISIIRNKKNVGFGSAVNQAAEQASGEFLLVLNPDTLLPELSITKLMKRIKREKKIGVIGPQLIDKKREKLNSVSSMPFLPTSLVIFSWLRKLPVFSKIANKYYIRQIMQTEKNVPVVAGACMLFRKHVFTKIGGFDERFFMYFEEADICYRVKKAGFRVLFYPQSEIVHLVGRSTSDTKWIKRTFQKSRFLFFKKYHGLIKAILAETFLRSADKTVLTALGIFLLSLFVNLYKITDLMIFFGDYGHDYLSARDMLLTGNIPLVGITSSVTWLHQGPLSIYFIASSFAIGSFHPAAPAVFYGILGALASMLLFFLGKRFFGYSSGVLAAIFFATSPLVIVNARAPYHTSAIPFFTILFLFSILYALEGRKRFFIFAGLFLGFLLQLELSNIVMVVVVVLLVFFQRKNIVRADALRLVGGVLVGILPFLIYDISNRFVQTGGLFLWTLNRVRLVFGLTLSGASTTELVPSGISMIWEQVKRVFFPRSDIGAFLLLLFTFMVTVSAAFTTFSKKTNHLPLVIVFLSLGIPLLGFAVHAAPGPAYFPLIYPMLALLVGYAFAKLVLFNKYLVVIPLFVFFFNSYYTVANFYFLDSSRYQGSSAPNWEYSFGSSLSEQVKASSAIVTDANGAEPVLQGMGFWRKFPSAIDNYKYLVWWLEPDARSESKTYLLVPGNEELDGQKVYGDEFVRVYRHE